MHGHFDSLVSGLSVLLNRSYSDRPMNEVKIEILEPELLETPLAGSLDIFDLVPPNFRYYENFLPSDCFVNIYELMESFSDELFILVETGTVKHSVTHFGGSELNH